MKIYNFVEIYLLKTHDFYFPKFMISKINNVVKIEKVFDRCMVFFHCFFFFFVNFAGN